MPLANQFLDQEVTVTTVFHGVARRVREGRPVFSLLTAALLIALGLIQASTLFAQVPPPLVNVTPLGSHSGELCGNDRALLFEDPTGIRILYDPGNTTDETDGRLGDVHVILLSHAHPDHFGNARVNRGAPGACGAPTSVPNLNTNIATIAVAKSAAVLVPDIELNGWIGLKLQAVRGSATPGCPTVGFSNETIVPNATPCAAILQAGGRRTVRRVSAGTGVQIIGVQAVHPNGILPAVIDSPGLAPGMWGYGGEAGGYVVRFTNGLVAYLTGDTAMFGDMSQIIGRFYQPNLVVLNMGDVFTMGPDDAVTTIQHLIRPRSVVVSHVNEAATSGGNVLAGTKTEYFMRNARGMADVIVPLSDVRLAFDGEGRCIGCR